MGGGGGKSRVDLSFCVFPVCNVWGSLGRRRREEEEERRRRRREEEEEEEEDKRATTNVQHRFVLFCLLSFLLFCSH